MEWPFNRPGPDFETRSLDLVQHGPVVPVVVTGRQEHRNTSGLIDTGASFCAIKPKLASRLNLPIIDKKRISGVSTHGTFASGDADVMMVMIGFEPEYSLPLQVVSADFLRDEADVNLLLGRPFLQHFDLFYEGACGRFKLTWARSQVMEFDD